MSEISPAQVPQRVSFDLITQPWITCRFGDGSVRDLSLREVFFAADSIVEITGELPTQSFALTRLLIAILSRSMGGSTQGREWKQLWEHGLPIDAIDAYLDHYRQRFDLLHPSTPFYQVADLHTARNEVKDVTQLIADLPSNNRLFTTRAGSGVESLSFAEAARWLVNVQAFDASGIKTGAVGDPRVTGGRGYPIGVAWCGLLGGVIVEGKNLRETLLLNLVSPQAPYTGDWSADEASWEREPDRPAQRGEDAEGPRPKGPADLATWQSRRVRLIADGYRIVGSLVANGDRLTPQNQHPHEMMTAWRYSEPQTKKNGGLTTFMPREHRPGRAFWRGISAILPTRAPVTTGKDHAPSLAPGVVQWISRLQEDFNVADEGLVTLRAIGVLYGSNNSVIDEVLDDRLPLPLALLSEEHPELIFDAVTAVELAEQGVAALRNLAANLARAAGQGELDLEGPRQRAEEFGYAALDQPYRLWVRNVTAAGDPNAMLAEWKSIALGILRTLGDELIAAAGPAAWVGRERPGRKGLELYTTSRATSWFSSALRNTFGETPREESVA